MLTDLGFDKLLQHIDIPTLTNSEEVKRVLELIKVEAAGGDQELEYIAMTAPLPMSIKTLLNQVDFFTRGNAQEPITGDLWKD